MTWQATLVDANCKPQRLVVFMNIFRTIPTLASYTAQSHKGLGKNVFRRNPEENITLDQLAPKLLVDAKLRLR